MLESAFETTSKFDFNTRKYRIETAQSRQGSKHSLSGAIRSVIRGTQQIEDKSEIHNPIREVYLIFVSVFVLGQGRKNGEHTRNQTMAIPNRRTM